MTAPVTLLDARLVYVRGGFAHFAGDDFRAGDGWHKGWRNIGGNCRQARHRFRVCRGDQVATRPMRVAYADPPYPGLARRYYGCDEVDHAELVAHLVADFPDGWALSTSAAALPQVLALCPERTRVCVWVKGPRHVRTLRALNAWEPLLVHGGRPRAVAVVEDLRDVLTWGGRQHSHPGALVGMKPARFCEWMFRLLGLAAGDDLADLFPGSGAVTRAWTLYTSRAPGRDASLLQEGDASQLDDADASLVDEIDPSDGAGVDASGAARHDASHRARRDGSCPPGGDTSREYSADTSPPTSGDA